MITSKEAEREKLQINKRGRINGEPNPLDVHFGKRMRMRRTLLGLSQQELAGRLGLTFQQVQKYETGQNRVGFSRACDIAAELKTDLNFFCEDMDSKTALQSPKHMRIYRSGGEKKPEDPMKKSETIKLVRMYYQIKPRIAAKFILMLMECLTSNEAGTFSKQTPEEICVRVRYLLKSA